MGLVEVPRPNFGFPGAWLACRLPGGQAIIHIYAGGPALGGRPTAARRPAPRRSTMCRCPAAATTLTSQRFRAARTRLARVPRARHHAVAAVRLRPERRAARADLRRRGREGAPPDMSRARVYRAGQIFFDRGVTTFPKNTDLQPTSCAVPSAGLAAYCPAPDTGADKLKFGVSRPARHCPSTSRRTAATSRKPTSRPRTSR